MFNSPEFHASRDYLAIFGRPTYNQFDEYEVLFSNYVLQAMSEGLNTRYQLKHYN